MINQFDKNNCKELRSAMEVAFKALNEKFGIQLSVGNMSYDNDKVNIKVSASTVKNGVALSEHQSDFNKYKEYIGMANYELDQIVVIQGKQYKLVGYKPRCNNPLLVERLGKVYRVAIDIVLQTAQK